MLNKKAIDKITAVIPDYLIQQRDGGGGKKLSYISGSTVIDILNAAFGYNWSWDVEDQFIQESQPKFNQYSKVPDSEKVMYNGKKGAWEPQAPIAHVKGVLTVEYKDEDGKNVVIRKTGFGSKVIMGGASEQESIFKAASTDALKKAASLLGIGAQLYRNEEETYFFYNELNYEDPWTDEELANHEEERNYIQKIMSNYSLEEDAMVDLIKQAGIEIESLSDVVPQNITAIVPAIKDIVAKAEAEKSK